MKDKYLGFLNEGDVYEYFDGRICYIAKLHEKFAVVYESERGYNADWTFYLRTNNWLREHVRTKLEVD